VLWGLAGLAGVTGVAEAVAGAGLLMPDAVLAEFEGAGLPVFPVTRADPGELAAPWPEMAGLRSMAGPARSACRQGLAGGSAEAPPDLTNLRG